MIHQYINEAEDTYIRITNNINQYSPNQSYYNKKEKIYFYINTKGYLHILHFTKDKTFNNFVIIDYMLTKDNMIKEKDLIILDKTKQSVIDYIEGLEAIEVWLLIQ